MLISLRKLLPRSRRTYFFAALAILLLRFWHHFKTRTGRRQEFLDRVQYVSLEHQLSGLGPS